MKAMPTAQMTLPIAERDFTRLQWVGLVLLGTLAMTLSSWIEVPMVPVPMTMQTLAVVMIGALYGAVLLWAAQASWGRTTRSARARSSRGRRWMRRWGHTSSNGAFPRRSAAPRGCL